MEVCVLILTPLPLEYQQVVLHLKQVQEPIYYDAATYEVGYFEGKHHTYKVVLREPGMHNTEMALATEKAIQQFQPHLTFLIGIAGGVKDVKIGDVLIAKKAYGYENGKEDSDGFKSRPAVESFSAELLARAQTLGRSDAWKKRTSDGATDAKVFIGPIAAGEKVVADVHNPTFQRIKTHYNDTIALEMEAIGFATALQHYRTIHGLAIRGISDLCAGKSKTDQQNWQPIAAERAAAVAFELLHQSDFSSFIIPNMDPKALAKAVYELLFPLPASFKEIGSDFANAANNDIREIWKRVKPLFIEEVEELAKDPEDADAQAGVRNRLKKALEGDEVLRGELERLVGKGKKGGVAVSVVNSRGVIIGSDINSGGGNINIG